MPFKSLGLHPSLVKAVQALGYTDPSPVQAGAVPPGTLVERIRWKAPYPLIRHHFGRPTVAETLGVRVRRLGAPRIPVGYAPVLEAVSRVSVEQVVATAEALMA